MHSYLLIYLSIRYSWACPLIEIRQAVPRRAILGSRISVSSTLPPSYTKHVNNHNNEHNNDNSNDNDDNNDNDNDNNNSTNNNNNNTNDNDTNIMILI